MEKLRVREGNTGILYLTDDTGKEERYIPDYDLDKARELLLEFQELKDVKGICVKGNYREEGRDWYPAMVSYLYWHLFFRYVKYKNLVDRYLDGELEFEFVNHADFSALVDVLKKGKKAETWKLRLFRGLVWLNNWLVLRWHGMELMFFRFALDDFRSKEIMKALNSLGAEYIQVVPAGRVVDILAGMLKRAPYYYYGAVTGARVFHHKYDLSGLGRHKRQLFERAVRMVECSISDYMQEYKIHLRRLRKTRIKTFYGFDDCNGYIFPLLYACQQKSIRTIGHQHGAYVRRHAGYVMEGIEKSDYRWFDVLIVWGEYWKEQLLRISKVYYPESIVVGSPKLKLNYIDGEESHGRPKGVLIPYEFAANTYKVGRYMERLVDLGYIVFFKPRPDEKLEDQLEAYCISQEYRKKIRIVNTITPSVMREIDIVAATMTTMAYELLPYRKIMWIFETEYRHLEDLVEQGLAHKIALADLDTLDEGFMQKTIVNTAHFFCQEMLEETLKKHVVGTFDTGKDGGRTRLSASHAGSFGPSVDRIHN